MRALLDTNIIIHRENTQVTNFTIGKLFHWLDKLHYDKLIHPYSIEELRKYDNPQMQSLYDAKLDAYTTMKSVAVQTEAFRDLLRSFPETVNDRIDNQLLYEVYCGRADILITEDRRMINKAIKIGILDKVYTINSFIGKVSNENPALIEYKVLAVKKEFFGDVDLSNSFFDTFREAYPEFDNWFNGKCDEEAYICRSDIGDILGFLYLKTESEDENYSDITPTFTPKKRLKVGTFKVEATGFRLGERFVKIIFDNAIARKVDEIYVTLFTDRPELQALHDLLTRWGFIEYGMKKNGEKTETVLVKHLGIYDESLSVKQNFPNITLGKKKFFLPIEAKFHSSLLPDSKLKTENEVDFLGDKSHKYALQKVYISLSYKRDMKPGDYVVLYRKGTTEGRKAYESAVTTIGIIDEVVYGFQNKEEFFRCCENRSIFSRSELENLWRYKSTSLLVVKFVFLKDLNKKLILKSLWDNGIIPVHSGPRPFDSITDEHFLLMLEESETELYTIEE